MENKEKVEKILDKVKKLFALGGNNPSEEEAKSAILKAQKLMAEYNLTLEDIEDDEISSNREISSHEFSTGSDNTWKYPLSITIANNFRCKVIWIGKTKVCFYGYKTDAEIAKETFQFLFKVCKKRMTQVADKAYATTGTSKRVRFSYSQGFVSGVKQVLEKQSTALMIIVPKEVEQSFEQNFEVKHTKVNYRSSGSFDKRFYDQGIQDGRDAIDSKHIESKDL